VGYNVSIVIRGVGVSQNGLKMADEIKHKHEIQITIGEDWGCVGVIFIMVLSMIAAAEGCKITNLISRIEVLEKNQ